MSLWTVQKRTGKSPPRIRPAGTWHKKKDDRRIRAARIKYFQSLNQGSGPLIPLAPKPPTFGEIWPDRPSHPEVCPQSQTKGIEQAQESYSPAT